MAKNEASFPFVRFWAYFFVFFFLFFGAQKALSPEIKKEETFTPGESEKISLPLRKRLHAIRALAAVEKAHQSTPEKAPQAPILNSASQLIVLAIPESRGIPDNFQKLLEKVAYSPALAEVALPLRVAVDYDRQEPRGTYADNTITVAALTDPGEMTKVLVHEMGHKIDVGSLIGTPEKHDPSDDFYAISWADTKVKKKGSRTEDFVSGYAQTNKYEDFAETFVMYVFHNAAFSRMTIKNKALAKKYAFFEKTIFPDTSYKNTSFELSGIKKQPWDTTKVKIDMIRFLSRTTK